MRLCLFVERSIAVAPAWRVNDALGTSGVGRPVLNTGRRSLDAGIKPNAAQDNLFKVIAKCKLYRSCVREKVPFPEVHSVQ